MTATVALHGVARTYPGPPAVRALTTTDLSIQRGEYVAIVGPSGSGKSTLLNVIGLLDRPTSGQYQLDGIDVANLGDDDRTALRARRIGFVFQAFHLLSHRSATENVALGLLYAGVHRRDRARLAARALERVGLATRLDAMPSTLSGGEQQRVAIARALVAEPALLIADEPTGNLDTETGGHLLNLLDELNASGVTIALVTHDPLVADRAGRLVRVRDGVVTAGDADAST